VATEVCILFFLQKPRYSNTLGLGLSLVTAYLAQPNNTVIAAVRDPSDAPSQALALLPKGTSSKLIIVSIESTSDTSAQAAIKELQTSHHLTFLDLVIANAGISALYPSVSAAKSSDMAQHYAVNVIGPVLLFQAVLPLLSKASEPKFVTMSSSAGTIIDMEKLPVPNAVYAPSKTALNWITKKIHVEHETIITFPMDPGWVQTEMGNKSAVVFGFEKAPLDLDTSISGMVKVVSHLISSVLVQHKK